MATKQGISAAAVVAELKRKGSARARAGMARFGLPADKAFGIPVGVLQRYARALGKNHELALALWKTGWYDARILASFLGEPDKVTPAQMNAWCRDFDNWGTVDTACFKLFDQSPHAWTTIPKWVQAKGEFQKRGGFVLMACLAAHDKTAADGRFLKCLPLIKRGATDERNFVKKGVSWALRGIGHRSQALHAAAVSLANELAASDDAAVRWVGKDALRDLNRPGVAKKLQKRGR